MSNLSNASEIIRLQIEKLHEKAQAGMLEESAVKSLEVLIRSELLLQKIQPTDDTELSGMSADDLKKLIGKPNA